MEQIAPASPDPETLAREADELRRWMDEQPPTTPLKKKAHEASMRALAAKIVTMAHPDDEDDTAADAETTARDDAALDETRR